MKRNIDIKLNDARQMDLFFRSVESLVNQTF